MESRLLTQKGKQIKNKNEKKSEVYVK